VAWTEEEHKNFLIGLQKLGKGEWRGISRHFVTTRTPTQVASHAQKYFIRQTNVSKRKRRSSLFDIISTPTDDGEGMTIVHRPAANNNGVASKATTGSSKASNGVHRTHGGVHKMSHVSSRASAQTNVSVDHSAHYHHNAANGSALTASLSNLADMAAREAHYVASIPQHQSTSTSTSQAIKIDEESHRSFPMMSAAYPGHFAAPMAATQAPMFDAYNQAMAQYMMQLQSLAAQQGDGMSHINQINQMNQMAWMAQQNLAYQMAAQNYAATPLSPQQNANFCRPTAIYAAKSIDDNVGEQRNAASGGA